MKRPMQRECKPEDVPYLTVVGISLSCIAVGIRKEGFTKEFLHDMVDGIWHNLFESGKFHGYEDIECGLEEIAKNMWAKMPEMRAFFEDKS